MNEEKKLDDFRRSMTVEAEDEVSRLQGEIRSLKGAREKRAAAQATAGEDKQIENAHAQATRISHQHTARAQSKKQKKLLVLRGELIDGVFEEAREKLRVFAAGKEYEGYLLRALKKLASAVPCDGAVIRLRHEDQHFAKKLQDAWPYTCTVEETDAFAIGGVQVCHEKKGLLAEETLDQALAEQQSWFRREAASVLDRKGGDGTA